MLERVVRLTRAELYKLSRQKFSYLLVLFVVFNAFLVGIGSKIFPAIMSALGGGGGATFDGYTFASVIETGTFGTAGAGTIAMLAFSGSVMASETDSGTIKNILVRPVRRGEFMGAKALSLFIYCFLLVVLMTVLSSAAGAMLYGMHDVTIPETGEVYRTQADMFMNIGISSITDIFSIYAVACLGLLVSVSIKNSGWAVITALVLYFPIMFLKNFEAFSPWIFTAYMDLGQNILREMVVVKSKAWLPDLYTFFAVNAITILAFLGLATAIFRKKEIH